MMPRKQIWTVRVVNWREDDRPPRTGSNYLPGVWVEQLRYMGHAREVADYDDSNVLEFYCPNPKECDTWKWADQNAARMRSFGIDAAAAPQWDDESTTGEAYRITATPEGRREYMERHNRRRNRGTNACD